MFPGRFFQACAAGLLVAGFLGGCGPVPKVEHVFIISFDQGAPADIIASDMPVLKRLAEEGAHTWEAYTIVPSLTLPSHVSMLTGLGPQKHQILWNEYEPEKGSLQVPTIFTLAKQAGLSTAIFAAKGKFQTLKTGGAPDFFEIPDNPTAESVARAFAAEVGKRKFKLCFIHFADPDTAGHLFGVHSPQKLKALADSDRALKTIMDAIEAAGLSSSSVVILTADHGGHDRTPEENAARALRGESYQPGTHGSAMTDDVVIPWIAWGAGVKRGHEIKTPVLTYDTAATALWLLGVPLPGDFWGRPVTEAFADR